MTWGIVGMGALFVVAAAYWRLVEQEQVSRGADAFRFRCYRVWFPLIIGVAALGRLPRALNASFPVVVVSDVLSFAPVVIVVGLGSVAAARKPGSGARTTTAPDRAGTAENSGEPK
ncbi:hypothetical protein ACIPC1_35860 [Streptomyces sp. NPDC087263]|uniref:hypothetical protein n=1 Tax=Streptomyces sp. NPDC087263 TaxID=3365773 RepID=UPI003830C29E